MARQTLAAAALLSVVGARRVVHLKSDRAKKRSRWKEKLKLPKKSKEFLSTMRSKYDRNYSKIHAFQRWYTPKMFHIFVTVPSSQASCTSKLELMLQMFVTFHSNVVDHLARPVDQFQWDVALHWRCVGVVQVPTGAPKKLWGRETPWKVCLQSLTGKNASFLNLVWNISKYSLRFWLWAN